MRMDVLLTACSSLFVWGSRKAGGNLFPFDPTSSSSRCIVVRVHSFWLASFAPEDSVLGLTSCEVERLGFRFDDDPHDDVEEKNDTSNPPPSSFPRSRGH